MRHLWITIFVSFLSIWIQTVSAQLPEGFEQTLLTDQGPNLTTLEFAENGYIYGSDFNGKIWAFVDDELQPEPVIDISDEVAGYGELGCLGFALHPDFMNNGYIYMLYVVDRHHLEHYGTDEYDPDKNQYEEATIGRVSRFELSTDDYTTLIPGSRTVIFGETYGEGNPALTLSHGTGDILFGSDGTLLLSTGDGNTWENNFAGGGEEEPSTSFATQGLEDGIISEAEYVGAFRAQQIQSYSGKVLRINAETGTGVPSNPFYDKDNPNSAESKVWALGLRNPYRMTLRPQTGSDNPEDGNPGTLYITDVGAAEWEEINVCDGPGYNFGWPLYEGMGIHWGFYSKTRKNLFQPNPIGDECNQHYFTFQELIVQENEAHNYHFPNPCNSLENIAEYAETFYHTRPDLTYRNDAWNQDGSAPLLPKFDNDGQAIGVEITTPVLEIDGAENFGGIAAMTGDFYSGNAFPEEYHQMLPILDYDGWLKIFWFDEFHNMIKMEHWLSDLENVIDIRYNPYDGCYYTMALWPSEINKICYSGNLRPVIDIEYSPEYGSSPLQVNFDASTSYDPENDPIYFSWDFGDGNTDTGRVVTHEFVAPDQSPISYEPVLIVTDSTGNQTSMRLHVSLNNTPPNVDISSVEEGQLYPMDAITDLLLEADVSDSEHSASELTYEWVTYLHHNTHFHPLTESNETSTVFTVNPVGCEEVDEYYYRISLRVTDSEGLEGYDELFIYPDCEGTITGIPNEFVLYPNPAKNWLRLRFKDAEIENQNYSVKVYDIKGRLVLDGKYKADQFENAIDLNVERLSEGPYLFRVLSEQEEEYSGQFLILKK